MPFPAWKPSMSLPCHWSTRRSPWHPALLVIGQLIDAIKHGGYDPHRIALFITQTGGGRGASGA